MAKGKNLPVVPATVYAIAATKASSDEALVASWVASLNSAHSRRNCERTAQRFLTALSAPLRQATVEDVREALISITASLAPTSARQIVLRVKRLLSYGHRLGYLQFNARAVIKVHGDTRSIAQRIVSEVEIGLLVRAARGARNRALAQVAYAGGLRISELVALTRGQIIRRDDGKVQLNVLGKGSKPRQVLLPDVVSKALLKLRGDAGDDAPIFANRAGGPLTDRAVNYMLKAAAERRAPARRLLSPLAAPRAREPRHRSRRRAASGAVNPRARQHRRGIRISPRQTRRLERPAPRSRGVSSMRRTQALPEPSGRR